MKNKLVKCTHFGINAGTCGYTLYKYILAYSFPMYMDSL